MPVITFSQKFQANHPRKGEPRQFVEQILNQMSVDYISSSYFGKLLLLNESKLKSGKLQESDLHKFYWKLDWSCLEKKLHTIRGGNRFAAGENFTPAVWSGKPYNSPQIIFFDNIEVVKTYEFMSEKSHGEYFYNITSKDGNQEISKGLIEGDDMFSQIAKNDGLSTPDFAEWFEGDGLDFSGQIICWADPKYLQA